MGWPHVAGVVGVLMLGVVAVAGNAPTLLDEERGIGVVRGSVLLASFYLVVCLTIFAYVRVVTADPGRPSGLSSPHMESGRAANGKEMRMCQKCKHYKPERCHHCSDCNQCTLKMDHHCPWVNNCVGFRNYKYFFLLLVYATCSEVYAVGLLSYCVSLRAGGGTWQPWEICAMVTMALVGLFALATVGLLLFHTHLISVNQTTIEQLKGIPVDQYSLGVCLNIKMVLGENPACWCIPCVWGVSPDFDGINWEHPAQRARGDGLADMGITLDAVGLDIAPVGALDVDPRAPAGAGVPLQPLGQGEYGKVLDPNATLGNGLAAVNASEGMPVYEESAMLAPVPCPPGIQAEQAAAASLRQDDGTGAATGPAQGLYVPAYSVNL